MPASFAKSTLISNYEVEPKWPGACPKAGRMKIRMASKEIPLIYNPRAGAFRLRPGLVAQLTAALSDRGVTAQPMATTAPGDATRLAERAVEAGSQMVIICGGDGTINEAAQALIGTPTALAVCSGGTANIFAKELRLPRDLRQLADRIAAGSLREISVGLARQPESGWQRYFLLMAGIGLDATIIEAVNPALKDRFGMGAYWAAGFRTLAAWPLTPFTLDLHGTSYAATFAVIAKATNYASFFTLAPRAQFDDDQLDVCLFNSSSRLAYLAYAALSVRGRHTISPQVSYQKVGTAAACSQVATPVQLDGELVGQLPMRFDCVPRALRVVI